MLPQKIPPLPVLDAQQRRAGYDASLELRRVRAELKKDLKAGKLDLAEVLTWGWVQTMKIGDLLRALPGVSNRIAARILAVAGVEQTKLVGRLGPRQIEKLLSEVEKRSGPPRIS